MEAPRVQKMAKKLQVIEWLQKYNVQHDPSMAVPDLKVQLRTKIQYGCSNDSRKLAGELGHQVIFTHPYHLDLQPIKLVWTVIKG